MIDSLIFDGTDDKINMTLLGGAGSGAMTILFIVKFDTYTNYPQILTWNSLDGGLMLMSDNSIVAGDFGAGSDVSPFLLSGTGWQLIGYGKALGSATPRYHRYVWDTATWTHGPGFNPINNFPALTSVRIGDSIAVPGQNFDGNMLIGGIWDYNLNDLAVESLIAGTIAWMDTAPVVAWRFNTVSLISTFTGAGQSTETSRTGTALATDVAPAGWRDEPAGGVERIALTVGADKTGAVSTWTDSVTVPAGANLLLLVAIHMDVTGDNVNGVQWNGAALTELAQIGATSWSSVQFWYLKNPTPGTGNLVTTLSGAEGFLGRQVAHVFSGVDQATTFRTAQVGQGDSNLISALTVPGVVAGDFIVDAITIDATGHNANAGGQQIEDYDDPASTACDTAGSFRAGAHGGSVSWMWTTPSPFSHIAVGVRVATTPPQQIRPDADVTTTGWTTAPLFSKVDEAVADDADFITSTAS